MGGRGGGAPGNANRSESAAQAQQVSSSPIDQTLDAIRRARRENGDWTSLDRIRDEMGGDRAEQDRRLMELSRLGLVRMIPEENQKALTSRDRAAAFDHPFAGRVNLVGIWSGPNSLEVGSENRGRGRVFTPRNTQ